MSNDDIDIKHLLSELVLEVRRQTKTIWVISLVPMSAVFTVGSAYMLAAKYIDQQMFIGLVILFMSPFYTEGIKLIINLIWPGKIPDTKQATKLALYLAAHVAGILIGTHAYFNHAS